MIRVYRNPELPPLNLGEQFLLPWWVQVPPNWPVSGLTVQLTAMENLELPDLHSPDPIKLSAEEVTSGEPISIDTPLKFHRPGHYAVGLRVCLAVATLGVLVFRSRNKLKLHVEKAGEKLVLKIESQSSVLVEADRLQDFAQVEVKARGPVLADLSELPTRDKKLGKAQQVIVEEFQLAHQDHEFPMVEVDSERAGPDLARFWEGWKQWFRDTPHLRELTLLAADGGPAYPVRVARHGNEGSQVKLRLMTQHQGRPSHLLLLSQSAEGNFMQCAPNEHGHVTMTPASRLHYPEDFFGDLKDEDGNKIDDLRFDAAGTERFLAVVTTVPLVDPATTIYLEPDSDGQAMNHHLPPLTVSKLLNAIWNHRQSSPQPPEMEIGFLEFEVVE